MFDRFFKRNNSNEKIVRKKITELISLSRILSSSSDKAISTDSERFKMLVDKSGFENWLLYSSAALIAMNIGSIFYEHKNLGEDRLHKIFKDELNEIDENYISAVNDFSNFTKQQGHDPNEHIAKVGLWIVWKLKQEKPTDKDLKLVSPLGRFLIAQVNEIGQTLDEIT